MHQPTTPTPADLARYTVADDAATVDLPAVTPPCAAAISTNDLLTRPVGSVLMYLALPVLGELTLLMLVGFVDMLLAGTLGKEATDAVGLASQMNWLANLLFGFIGAGATALVSRHAGAGLHERANHFSNQSLAVAAFMGTVAYVLIAIAAPLLPLMLGWQREPGRLAVMFLRIDAAGQIVASITIIAGACWRGMGDTRTPLYVMSVVNVVNMGMSTLLRFGCGPIPSLGVAGIATGTMIAQVCGFLLVIYLLTKGRSGIRLNRPDLRFHAASLKRILNVGIPAGLDGVLLWLGQFGFLAIISRLAEGEDQAATVAAHFVGIRAESLSYLPAMAWATAASTIVGQSLGAGLVPRARQSGHLAALHASVLCVLMGVIYYVFAPQIYALFNASQDLERVARIGVPALRGLAMFQLPLALMIVYTVALRGAGDTRFPLLFTVLGMLAVRLPLAYVCGIVLHGGLLGAWVGMFADMTARALLNTWRFTRGRWVYLKV